MLPSSTKATPSTFVSRIILVSKSTFIDISLPSSFCSRFLQTLNLLKSLLMTEPLERLDRSLLDFRFYIMTKRSETILETDLPVLAECSLADFIS